MLVKTKAPEIGKIMYSWVENGVEVARLRLSDSRYKNYVFIPLLDNLEGSSRGILHLLNTIVGKSKGPVQIITIAPRMKQLVSLYGFHQSKEKSFVFVWDPNAEEVAV